MLQRRKTVRPAIQHNDSPRPRAVAESLERRTLLAITVFTIQPDLSKVTLSGEALTFNLSRQSTGSLTDRFEGAIVADVTPGNIRFIGGSDIAAETRGRFSPGNAPGNYAAVARQFDVTVLEAVVRGLMLDFISQPVAVSPTGTFASNAVRVRTNDGRFDYDVATSGEGSFGLDGADVVNSTATPSTFFELANGTSRLTIPIDATFNYSNPPAELKLKGQITAVAGADRGLRPRVDANGPLFGTANRAAFITGAAAPPVFVNDSTGMTVLDFDDATLAGATAVLEPRPDQPDEVLAVDTSGTPITANYDPATGTLALTGAGTTADYQQVLRTLTYDNNAAESTFGERTVRITVSDAAGPGLPVDNVVSVEEPFSTNVARIGTNPGPAGGRAVTFTDGDGTVTTITLIGGGHAYVRFENVATQSLADGVVRMTGTGVNLLRIDVTGTNALSRLAFRAVGGNATVDVGGIDVQGPLASVGGRGVNLTGDLNVEGRLVKAAFNNVTNADVTAANVVKMSLTGSMTGSTLTLEDPYAPLVPVLGNLSVRGPITGSRIAATGNIGSIKAGGLVDSEVYAGVTGPDRFPSTAGAFLNEAFILKLTLKAPLGTSAFSNSVIAANNLGRVGLGLIDTDNAGTPFGVTADRIVSLGGTNAAGERLRLINLDDPAALAAAIPTLAFTFGDFAIRLV